MTKEENEKLVLLYIILHGYCYRACFPGKALPGYMNEDYLFSVTDCPLLTYKVCKRDTLKYRMAFPITDDTIKTAKQLYALNYGEEELFEILL